MEIPTYRSALSTPRTACAPRDFFRRWPTPAMPSQVTPSA